MKELLEHKPPVKNIVINLRLAALISFLLVLAFAILELFFNTITRQNALGVVVLFGLLWLLPMAFIAILAPVLQTPAGNKVRTHPLVLLLRVAFLALIAVTWLAILIDQLPCFIGLPNCD